MATSVLIVDDHSSFRAAARLLLEHEGYRVVGEAETGSEGVARAAELQPDFVLLDVNLPDINGFQVAERLTAGGAGPAIVLTSSHDGADFGRLIEGSGARGFIPKADLSGARLAALLP